MNRQLIRCDGSDFAFTLMQDGRQWVAIPHYRGQSLAIEFREDSPELVQLAIAAWLLQLTVDARARH